MRSRAAARTAGFGQVERAARPGRARAGGRRRGDDGGERCRGVRALMADGGVVLFPSDTVYGLACDPRTGSRSSACTRSSAGRRTSHRRSCSSTCELALAALPELGPQTQAALARLLPGAVTVLVPNPARRFPLACGDDPRHARAAGRVGARAGGRAGGRSCSRARTSPGGADARRLSEVPPAMRAGADLVIDGGELPGIASTVVDLREYEDERAPGRSCGRARSTRTSSAAALEGQFHFDPADLRGDGPGRDPGLRPVPGRAGRSPAGQRGAARCSSWGPAPGRRRGGCWSATRTALAGRRRRERRRCSRGARGAARRAGARWSRGRAAGSAARRAVRPGGQRAVRPPSRRAREADLFARVRAALAPGGRFVLGDVVVPGDAGRRARSPLDAGLRQARARSPTSSAGCARPGSSRRSSVAIWRSAPTWR